MNALTTSDNPVGEVIKDEAIDNFIKIMSAEWDESKEERKWYEPWKRVSFVKVTRFLTKALDDLIAYVDDYVDKNGADKKATVLNAVSKLYDYVAHEAMPVFLKPLSPMVKKFIIDEMLSPSIDWVVSKYREGDWRKKPALEVAEIWALKAQSLNNYYNDKKPDF